MKKRKSLETIRGKLKGKKLFVVPYMHADWAWCHTREWHVRRYLAIFEDVAALTEQKVGYKWYMDCFRTEIQPVLERKPELLARIQKHVQEGDIQIAGSFANVRPNLVGDEAYIRNMVIGRKKFQACFPGAEIIVHGDGVDVAPGHPQIPQLISKAGYKYLRAGRPYEVLEKKGLKREFYWQGLDGSKVLVWWGEYGGMFEPEKVKRLQQALPDWRGFVEELYDQELEQYRRNSNADVIWVGQGCDDVLPLRAFNSDLEVPLVEAIRQWNENEESEMCFAGPNDFFRALEKGAEKIETHVGTIDICDVCYNVAWGGEQGLVHRRLTSSQRICEAETWQLLNHLQGGKAPDDLQSIWEEALTASCHATAWLFTRDYDEMLARIDAAIGDANRLKMAAQRAIAERIGYDERIVTVAFNSLAFPRTEILHLTLPSGFADGLYFEDGAGNRLPHQLLRPYEYTDSLWEWEALVQVTLPPMGWTAIRAKGVPMDCRLGGVFQRMPQPETHPASRAFAIKNDCLRLEFEAGRLSCILDLETGRPQPAEGSAAWNDLLFTEIDTDKGVLHAGPIIGQRLVQFQTATLLENGPLRWRVQLTGSDGRVDYTQEITLHAGSREIGFAVRFHWPRTRGRLSARIPVTAACTLRGGIPFGSEEKNVDAEPYTGPDWDNMHRQWPGLFCAKDYVRAVDGDTSAALISIEGDRFYLLNRKASALEYILINSAQLIPGTWEDSVNRRGIESVGEHTIRYALRIGAPGEGDLAAARAASQLRSPADLLLPYVGNESSLPSHGSLLQIAEANIQLSAWYADGEDAMLRIYEAEGTETTAHITLPAAVAACTSEDFIGNPDGREITLAENTIVFETMPHEIVTLRLRGLSKGK